MIVRNCKLCTKLEKHTVQSATKERERVMKEFTLMDRHVINDWISFHTYIHKISQYEMNRT